MVLSFGLLVIIDFSDLNHNAFFVRSLYHSLCFANEYMNDVANINILPHNIRCGVEHKDEIYSCAQLEARQQKSVQSEDSPAVEAVNSSAASAATVKTSDKVLKENININNSNNNYNDLKKKLTPEKEAEQVVKVIRKVPAPISANQCVIRPISVTASIFSSVAKKPIVASAAAATTTATATPVVEEKPPERKVPQSVTAKLFVKPKHATDKIFAPRTEDMNKGFLMFSEEEPGLTMLKDEPDDLTHLAPTAGDACIPLEETGQFFNDVFDDFMIPDNYTSLLQDDLSSLDSSDHQLRSSSSISVASPIALNESTVAAVGSLTSAAMSQHLHHSPNSNSSHSSTSSSVSASAASTSSSASNLPSLASVTSGIGSAGSSVVSQNINGGTAAGGQTTIGSGASNDPFINYRDEITEISHSPQHLLSPELSKSPEGSSIPSLCSPNGSGCPEDELAFMTLNMDDDDLTMSMRAPYISMSEVDDLPLLTSDDLMWGAPAAPVDSATAAAMVAAAGKYLVKEEYTPTQPLQQQQLSPQANNTTTSVSAAKSTAPSVTVTARIADLSSANSHNNENNCNIGNKTIDSSLAALLCGGNVINIQLQQQQQQQSLNGNRHILVHHQQQPQHQVIAAAAQAETDKRIKLIDSSNLMHPMVVITPNFNKNSNTIETWSMNDLLQLNGATNSTTNGTTTVTTAPGQKLNLITSIVSKKNTTANNNSSGIVSHKRTLSESADGSSKRVKPNPTITVNQQQSPTSSPQLLQQLMAPSPVPAKSKAKSKSLLDQAEQHRWATGKVNGLQEQASNSVLMNLLVSGCDTNIPKFSPEMIVEDQPMYDPNELTDDEDEDRIPILANPMLGSTTTAATSTGQLTIQTENIAPKGRGNDDFMMTVSPSLLTPSDLEIWRAIKQGLDPKKIPQNYGLSVAAGYGDRYSKSMATTPTAQLGMIADDPHDGAGCDTGSNLLSVLDPAMAISGLRTDEDDDVVDNNGTQLTTCPLDYEMTIPVNEILQNNLI
ncbi:AAEL001056-PA [Aedes aegypti]|uniref:AAEL001056-PA n=1 Tax=Aedes aegypti TaxID=7159 RepID=Q17MC0_AEDAE|nr:AAEL001056-PA [Aedes aegypti]